MDLGTWLAAAAWFEAAAKPDPVGTDGGGAPEGGGLAVAAVCEAGTVWAVVAPCAVGPEANVAPGGTPTPVCGPAPCWGWPPEVWSMLVWSMPSSFEVAPRIYKT